VTLLTETHNSIRKDQGTEIERDTSASHSIDLFDENISSIRENTESPLSECKEVVLEVKTKPMFISCCQNARHNYNLKRANINSLKILLGVQLSTWTQIFLFHTSF
jgi:replicative superfamily II helicase